MSEIHEFTIRGMWNKTKTKCFPSLNELLSSAERTPFQYNRDKKKYEQIAIDAIRVGLKGWKTKNKVHINYIIAEPSSGKKRDYSNIRSAAEKIIEDALQKAGVIENDDPKHVDPSSCEFIYTNETPYITVQITEV